VPSVSVVIPAFNEESGIARQIHGLQEVLGSSGWTTELLVVDDGSTDATAARAEACGAHVLRLGRNNGYGAALIAGIDATQYDWILITDADCTYPAAAVADLLREAGEGAMVVGARVTATTHPAVLRRSAKWVLRQYAGFLARQRIPDLNSGMRLIRRSSIASARDLLPRGFSFTSTITLSLLATGQGVSFVPIDYLPRAGQSKIRPVDFFRMFRQITRVMLHYFPLRVMSLWGLVLWAAAAAVAWPAGPAAALAAGAFFGLSAGLSGLWLDRKVCPKQVPRPWV